MPPKKNKAAVQVALPAKDPAGSPILAQMTDAMNLIENHNVFCDLLGLTPLGQGDGGAAPVFDPTSFGNSLGNGVEYVCTGNLAWVDWKYTTSPGVLVLRSAVEDYAASQYSDAKNLGIMKIVIAADSAGQSPPP